MGKKRNLDNKRLFKNQNYEKIKAECIKKGSLFVDIEFPPTNGSLFLDDKKNSDIVWKRPGEIVMNPQLFVEGAEPNDVTQGILGNCWFVSASSALTHNKYLMKKVIPNENDQEWKEGNIYTGCFRFCFWRFGEWLEVVIDDLLPTKDGELIFARSKSTNEFWSALLEKAFAKLFGCYENLCGGQLADALLDVSGGVPETIRINKFINNSSIKGSKINKLFKHLQREFDNGALLVAAIAAQNKEEIEESLVCGLVKGHAYAVTAVRYIDLDARNASFKFFNKFERKMMIRLQNPWGEKEWNGSWSDGSEEWNQVTDTQKKDLGITVEEDGEFWMPFNEFINYFTDISVCRLFNTSNPEYSDPLFIETRFIDEWSNNGSKSGGPNDRAGGCLNFKATCCLNPQYMFDVISCDDNDIILALTQKDENEGLKERESFITIGIYVMRVEINRECRIHQPLEVIGTSDYTPSRSTYLHLQNLKKGRYIIIPSTYAPKETGKYLLRIFTKGCSKIRCLNNHIYYPSKLIKCYRPKCIIRINVKNFEIEEKEFNNNNYCLYYCVIKSNGQRVKSRKLTNSLNFEENFIFHSIIWEKNFTIQLWKEEKKKKYMIGERKFTERVENDKHSYNLNLLKNIKNKEETVGQVFLEISSYDDPMYL
ncbi:Peptidase C2, calpain, catalytic domain and Peptidase C2, calpain, large subunit, domain III and Peptidase C2, calpain, domain III and Peptidase C2, calpain family-containing protein [Strongyloides ratti]|uniref:Peptidase C2, calpain, catalytic domain and Peptidase C2, calpain, large subunit, domain III and Peptidase C2, calpain, domain III and Peptidase C2, calpain family-containing protein n=1 Tax=Strongyloides ratti TaxID=34506 RepID=A0A090MTS7_STRRB|nr:Peptidase C2, calpain, catalytic domain and Peptidase C2, calpain, large subunit, domain III and Peptidase C2, calpain, domain III and Peptidase C2, calpain family-containing protein [Strongyloides ratti]CEF61728.1 Peptidase C2, calpain, catalytic domain and Peptidase C2, calpain, large subunit, domain III and Peptidase C2, calpain, domain III and Peptidase C2, calpain family-containing protein [Strongyloides ratti]